MQDATSKNYQKRFLLLYFRTLPVCFSKFQDSMKRETVKRVECIKCGKITTKTQEIKRIDSVVGMGTVSIKITKWTLQVCVQNTIFILYHITSVVIHTGHVQVAAVQSPLKSLPIAADACKSSGRFWIAHRKECRSYTVLIRKCFWTLVITCRYFKTAIWKERYYYNISIFLKYFKIAIIQLHVVFVFQCVRLLRWKSLSRVVKSLCCS